MLVNNSPDIIHASYGLNQKEAGSSEPTINLQVFLLFVSGRV